MSPPPVTPCPDDAQPAPPLQSDDPLAPSDPTPPAREESDEPGVSLLDGKQAQLRSGADPIPSRPPPKEDSDPRASSRYMVDWRIALVFDHKEEKLTFRGRTYDLSMNGTAMLTHHNVFSKAPVTILLAPPPLHKGGSKKVIEIQAHQVYAVYSGEHSCFRLGFKFIKFKGDGKDILRETLAHYQPSYYKGDKSLG